MRKRKRINWALICLLILVILVGAAMVTACVVSASDFGGTGSIFSVSEQLLSIFFGISGCFVGAMFLLAVSVFARSYFLKKSLEKLQKKAADVSDGVAAVSLDSEEEESPRFYMLNEIDEKMREKKRTSFDEKITLDEFCLRFRMFAASKLKLYYSIEDIRKFVANLACTKVLIMQGMSGTGKTSLAYAFGEFISNSSAIVPIQPMWKERSDLLGYYNEFTKRFNETVLLQKMYEANYCPNMFVVVLDEMNIARVEYYFAEFLSLLEIPREDKRYIEVVSDVWESDPKLLKNGRLKLPPNMWFIGTANNDDSTFAISDKVYDRAMIMNLDKKAESFDPEDAKAIQISASYFDNLARKAKKEYKLTARNRRRLKMLDDYMIDCFKITFGNRIMKQIETFVPVYIACGGNEIEALDDIISKKVLRKLETQNPIYVRNHVEGLCNYLDELFGYDKMVLCKAYLSKFERSM